MKCIVEFHVDNVVDYDMYCMILPVHFGCVVILHLFLFLLSIGNRYATIDRPRLEDQ